jgi:hypothetical protein
MLNLESRDSARIVSITDRFPVEAIAAFSTPDRSLTPAFSRFGNSRSLDSAPAANQLHLSDSLRQRHQNPLLRAVEPMLKNSKGA